MINKPLTEEQITGRSKSKINPNRAFNTRFKAGDILLCVEDVVYYGDVLFRTGESYTVNSIDYGQVGNGYQTKYKPYYLVNGWTKTYPFFSPDEEFVTNENTHGGSGMSGHGNINVHFQKQSNT